MPIANRGALVSMIDAKAAAMSPNPSAGSLEGLSSNILATSGRAGDDDAGVVPATIRSSSLS
jgi:hypothetical protein